MSTPASVKKVLNELLRDPGNAYCADCKTQSHPRWASWSLGVFICIKCAGVHRSLGTHISKVKSVDLDTWKEEHLKALVSMGNNENANRYYEAKLDSQRLEAMKGSLGDMHKLQSFIRSKYEYKKWIGSPEVLADIKQHNRATGSTNLHINNPKHVVSSNEEDAATAAGSSVPPKQTLIDLNEHKSRIYGSGGHSTNSLLNIGSLSDSLPKSNASTASVKSLTSVGNPTPNGNTTSRGSTTPLNQRPDLKKSILSLYSKAPTSQRTMNTRSAINLGTNAPLQTSSAASSTFALNLGPKTTSGVSNNGSTISLEDNELFKNVWS